MRQKQNKATVGDSLLRFMPAIWCGCGKQRKFVSHAGHGEGAPFFGAKGHGFMKIFRRKNRKCETNRPKPFDEPFHCAARRHETEAPQKLETISHLSRDTGTLIRTLSILTRVEKKINNKPSWKFDIFYLPLGVIIKRNKLGSSNLWYPRKKNQLQKTDFSVT